VLLGLNAAWHGAAAYYFLCRPMGILKKYFNFTPIPTHAHLVRYLGTYPHLNLGTHTLLLSQLFY